MRNALAFFLLMAIGSPYSEVVLPHQQLRIAFIFADNTFDVPSSFLLRAKQNGYNYVLALLPYDARHWNTNGTVNSTFVSDLTAAFTKADSYGMRLIPHFQQGNAHSSPGLRWSVHQGISPSPISDLLWNVVGHGPCAGPGRVVCEMHMPDSSWAWNYTQSFAPDPVGANAFDYTYKQLLVGIKSAFVASGLDSLRYIHLGHDEPVGGWGLDPNNPFDMTPGNLGDTLAIGNSTVDSAFIAARPHGTQAQTDTAFCWLMANELERRVYHADSILANMGTKIMVWADAYDPQHQGGQPTPQLFNGHTVYTSGVLKKISGPTKSKLILMPWMYPYSRFPGHSANDYNTDSTYAYFKANGFKFIYTHEIGDDCVFNDGVGGGNGERFKQLSEYIGAAQQPIYRQSVLGYTSVHWCTSPTSISFKSLEYHSHWALYQTAILH
jgi:hypothetical protein